MKGSNMFTLFILLFWLAFMGLMFKKPITNFFFRPNVEVEKHEIVFVDGIREGSKEPVLEGVASNDSEYTAENVILKFKLYDTNGVVLDDVWISIDSLLPGERWKFKRTWMPSETVEAKLVEVKLRNF